jgi:signal-transduction protein with cAMP-binding, CBS, and nucleotidyltransferase domain
MKLMTQLRVRHVPVKDCDQLVGIVSIGDILKHRLDELELEANVMRDYAVAGRH